MARIWNTSLNSKAWTVYCMNKKALGMLNVCLKRFVQLEVAISHSSFKARPPRANKNEPIKAKFAETRSFKQRVPIKYTLNKWTSRHSNTRGFAATTGSGQHCTLHKCIVQCIVQISTDSNTLGFAANVPTEGALLHILVTFLPRNMRGRTNTYKGSEPN